MGAIFIDGYLYVKPGKAFYLLQVRQGSRANSPNAEILYLIETNAFGLFDAVKLSVAPKVLGVQTRVDHLKDITGIERRALRELLRSLAVSLRNELWTGHKPKFSIKVHALLPRADESASRKRPSALG